MLINVMRTMAHDAGWSDDAFDLALSVYIQAGTMTEAERQALVHMTHEQRMQWLISKRYPIDALPMVSLDFDAHGFITRAGLAKFNPAAAHAE